MGRTGLLRRAVFALSFTLVWELLGQVLLLVSSVTSAPKTRPASEKVLEEC